MSTRIFRRVTLAGLLLAMLLLVPASASAQFGWYPRRFGYYGRPYYYSYYSYPYYGYPGYSYGYYSYPYSGNPVYGAPGYIPWRAGYRYVW